MPDISYKTLTINSSRLKDDFDELASIGVTENGGISRLALSNEDLEARAWFANRIEEAGMIVRDDEVGNLSGFHACSNPLAKTFLIGSHLDTVTDGGNYDGATGVLIGLEILRTIKEAAIDLPVHLEVINFTDQEGTWHSFFGSLGVVGHLDEKHLSNVEEDNGAFRVALFRAGIRPSEIHLAQRDPETLAGYLEVHIEQGERLERAQKQIGVVTGIVGRSTYHFNFYGQATHAATTASDMRQDALQGAAIFITQMHKLVRESYPDGIVNCGNVHVSPGTFSVVPAQASLRIEVRHPHEQTLAELESRLIRLAHDCAREYRLSVNVRTIFRRPAIEHDLKLTQAIVDVCREQERTHMPIVSYAGHDSQIMSRTTPSAMIFLPSYQGISHNPKEYTDWGDVVAGANVALHTLLRCVY
jgi:beta-ureidopropionase / N-carbamoyl-L-amino-acid hydrolase